jgi:hypothetical protein
MLIEKLEIMAIIYRKLKNKGKRMSGQLSLLFFPFFNKYFIIQPLPLPGTRRGQAKG